MVKRSGCNRYDLTLLGLSQTHGAVTKIVDAVPLPQESVSQNSEGTNWLREVHTHKGADAGALDLQRVVIGANGEVVTGQSESEIGQGVTLVAFNRILTSEALLGTNLLVAREEVSTSKIPIMKYFDNLQEVSKSGWQGNKRSAGVENDTGVLKLSDVVTKSNGIEVNLPVRLSAERNLGHFTGVVVLVNTTEAGLGVVAFLICVSQVEGEDRVIQKALV
jgi:hypothetical protein